MQSEFNVVLSSIHPVSFSLPVVGEVNLPAQSEFQLLNASIDTVNYLRSTFSNTGVTVSLNKESKTPFRVFDYKSESVEDKKNQIKKEQPLKSPLEKAGDFVLPSGKHKGKKVKELDENSLRMIAKMNKNQTVKSTIEAYLILKESK